MPPSGIEYACKNMSSLNKANGDRRSESANLIILLFCSARSDEGNDDDIVINNNNNYNNNNYTTSTNYSSSFLTMTARMKAPSKSMAQR